MIPPQQIPDKGTLMVRYSGLYSNMMRGIAVIEDPRIVEKLLWNLGVWHDPLAIHRLGPLRGRGPMNSVTTSTPCPTTKM